MAVDTNERNVSRSNPADFGRLLTHARDRLAHAGWIPSISHGKTADVRIRLTLELAADQCRLPLEEAVKLVPVSDQPKYHEAGGLDEGCVAYVETKPPALGVSFAGFYRDGVEELVSILVQLGEPSSV
ncbi:MAG TPA: hypothetical protein VGF75_00110 [Candidatus Saccharimonadales bacterium]|jgi:hypothetical protein